MATNVLMPALSPTMEQGKLSKWVKKVGDAIKSGDVLAEIETDKATMEVEAVDEGTLSAILVEEGTDNVAVNTPIGVIGPTANRPMPRRPLQNPPTALPRPLQRRQAPNPVPPISHRNPRHRGAAPANRSRMLPTTASRGALPWGSSRSFRPTPRW